jgi:hypothetical protein
MEREARFVLRPSVLLGVLLSSAALLVLVLLLLLPLHAGVSAIAALWMLYAVFRVLLRDAWLRRPDSCVALRCDTGRRVLLARRDGMQLGGQVCGDTLVMPWLVLLNVRIGTGGRRSLVLLPDSLPREDFRRLRVLLRNSGGVQP